MPGHTFLASFGQIGLRLLERHGIDADGFARELGVRRGGDPLRRLPSELLDRAFVEAARRIGDPAFALQAGECWHPSDLGVLGYAWLSSASLAAALQRMARYTKLLGQRMAARCVDEPRGLRFVYEHGRGDESVGLLMADFDLSVVVAMCRFNAGAAFRPAELTLRRPEPARPAAYHEVFGCPVVFAAPHDSLLVGPADTTRELGTAQHELSRTFDVILARQLAALGDADLASRCRAWMLEQLTSGEPSDEELARHLALSPRTLHRRLREQGLSYRRLLEDTRFELARHYLRDPRRSITEITFLLGFSEQSAFTRAFKRWSGAAPSSYRSARALAAVA